MALYFDQYGIQRDTRDMLFIEHIENLKRKSGSNPWPVIDAIIELWKGQPRNQWKSYLHRLDDVRDTRADKKFGQSRSGMFRYTLDIPQKIMFLIRKIYSDEELPMTKEFFRAFARKYPYFTIAEKN